MSGPLVQTERIDRVPIVLMRRIVPGIGHFFRYATTHHEVEDAKAADYHVLDASFCLWAEGYQPQGADAVHRLEKKEGGRVSQALIRESSTAGFGGGGWSGGKVGYAVFPAQDGAEGQVGVRSRDSFEGPAALQLPASVLQTAHGFLADQSPYREWGASWAEFGALSAATLEVRPDSTKPSGFRIDGPGDAAGDVRVQPGKGSLLCFRRPAGETFELNDVDFGPQVELLDSNGQVIGREDYDGQFIKLHVGSDMVIVQDDDLGEGGSTDANVAARQYEYTLTVLKDGAVHSIDPKITNQSGGLRDPGGN